MESVVSILMNNIHEQNDVLLLNHLLVNLYRGSVKVMASLFQVLSRTREEEDRMVLSLLHPIIIIPHIWSEIGGEEPEYHSDWFIYTLNTV